MAGRVVHFELPADDVGRARAFYGEVFGWRMQGLPEMGYTLVATVPTDERGMPVEAGAINGGMLARQEPVTAPVITVEVDDIDEVLAAVEARGGATLRGRLAVGDMGFAAYFRDSEGNVVGLWQHARR